MFSLQDQNKARAGALVEAGGSGLQVIPQQQGKFEMHETLTQETKHEVILVYCVLPIRLEKPQN